jgi:hypothetical protein
MAATELQKLEQRLDRLEQCLFQVQPAQREAVFSAVAELVEAWLPDPFGEKRPDPKAAISVQQLHVVVNRLRDSAAKSRQQS